MQFYEPNEDDKKEANPLKYWRGYLVAGIVAALTAMITAFAATHSKLVDMVYPYISRMIMDYMAGWSAGVSGVLWQTIITFFIVILLATLVLVIVFKWNPIQWFGWVLAVMSVFSLLGTGIYGLNKFAGPIEEDMRLELKEYSVSSLEKAAVYYRDTANKFARNFGGQVERESFESLALSAADGFERLTYEQGYPIFSGTTVPVKKMPKGDREKGVTGKTYTFTGESLVNPDMPAIGLPYAISIEMCHRMCISDEDDAKFGAIMACISNADGVYVYTGYLMAYRVCYNALKAVDSTASRQALARLESETDPTVLRDIRTYNAFFGAKGEEVEEDLCRLLVSWHIQEINQDEEETNEDVFDPMDETDYRLEDIVGND